MYSVYLSQKYLSADCLNQDPTLHLVGMSLLLYNIYPFLVSFFLAFIWGSNWIICSVASPPFRIWLLVSLWCLFRARNLIWFWFITFFQEYSIGNAIYFILDHFRKNLMSVCSTLGDFKIDWWVVVMSSITKLPINFSPNGVSNHWWMLSGSIISLGVTR